MQEHNENNEKRIPEFLHPLFWEFDVKQIDPNKYPDTIMGRIMERGPWNAMCWLLQAYANDQIVSFLERRGRKVLPPREMNYWALVSGVPQEKRTLWMEEARRRSDVWRDRSSH